MKKTLIVLSLIFTAFTMNAQYEVENQFGNEIIDGMVVEFSDYGVDDASLNFFITNTGPDEIYMRIEFVSAVNADWQLVLNYVLVNVILI